MQHFEAFQNSNWESAEYLLNCGATIYNNDTNSSPCLNLAVDDGRVDILKFLVAKGVDITRKDNEGFNLMHIACFKNKLSILEFLFEIGMNINEKGQNDSCPLLIGSLELFVFVFSFNYEFL